MDAVETAVGRQPRVLDLAGATGSIMMRCFDGSPTARAVIMDVDPVLLTNAQETFASDDRADAGSDLLDPFWIDVLRLARPLTAGALYCPAGNRIRPPT